MLSENSNFIGSEAILISLDQKYYDKHRYI